MNTTPYQTYQLLITLTHGLTIPVGRFGVCAFPAGRYCYTGSAKRNFEARIARHLSREKRLHWHIDYLLLAEGVAITDVRRLMEDECVVNAATEGQILIPGFGASDCRAKCGSHLKYLGP